MESTNNIFIYKIPFKRCNKLKQLYNSIPKSNTAAAIAISIFETVWNIMPTTVNEMANLNVSALTFLI